jgi:hypothetical protein
VCKIEKKNQNVKEMQQLPLEKFDITSLSSSDNVLVLGPRRSGKSTLLKEIIHHNVLNKLVFSFTESVSPFYGKFMNRMCVYPEISSDVIKHSISTSFDTMITVDDLTNWDSIKDVYYNDRLHFVLSCSHPAIIPNDIIDNDSLGYVFIFNQTTPMKQHIYNKFMTHIGMDYSKLTQFSELLSGTAFTCLVLKLSRDDPKVFWYKASESMGLGMVPDVKYV